MLERSARWCYHRRRLVLVLWIAAFLAFGFLGKALDGGDATSAKLPRSDSIAGYDLLKARFPQQAGDSVRVVFKADQGVNDPSVQPRVEALLGELSHQPHVSATTSPFSQPVARNISPDRTIAYGDVQLDKPGF